MDKINMDCPICGNKRKPFFQGCVDTYFYKNGIPHRVKVCSVECKDKWEEHYKVEEYKGNTIYKVGDDIYVPYLECDYYFKTVEDCKKRIDNPYLRPVTPMFMAGLCDAVSGQ